MGKTGVEYTCGTALPETGNLLNLDQEHRVAPVVRVGREICHGVVFKASENAAVHTNPEEPKQRESKRLSFVIPQIVVRGMCCTGLTLLHH